MANEVDTLSFISLIPRWTLTPSETLLFIPIKLRQLAARILIKWLAKSPPAPGCDLSHTFRLRFLFHRMLALPLAGGTKYLLLAQKAGKKCNTLCTWYFNWRTLCIGFRIPMQKKYKPMLASHLFLSPITAYINYYLIWVISCHKDEYHIKVNWIFVIMTGTLLISDSYDDVKLWDNIEMTRIQVVVRDVIQGLQSLDDPKDQQ